MKEWLNEYNENQPSMDSVLAKALLRKINAQPFSLEKWEKGEPVIWVVSNIPRTRYEGAQLFPQNKLPSVTLLESPDNITPVYGEGDAVEKSVPTGYSILNKGKNIFYYAINPTNKELTLVKTSSNDSLYSVEEGELFSAKEFIEHYKINI